MARALRRVPLRRAAVSLDLTIHSRQTIFLICLAAGLALATLPRSLEAAATGPPTTQARASQQRPNLPAPALGGWMEESSRRATPSKCYDWECQYVELISDIIECWIKTIFQTTRPCIDRESLYDRPSKAPARPTGRDPR